MSHNSDQSVFGIKGVFWDFFFNSCNANIVGNDQMQ